MHVTSDSSAHTDFAHLRTRKLSHDDLFLLIASTVPCHTDALRLIDDVGLGWGGVNNVPLDIHLHDDSCLLIASFIHSFIHPSKPRVQPRSACTTEQIQARVQASKFRVHSRGSARSRRFLEHPFPMKNAIQYL